ncbi:uncharacterized protein LOC126900972 [Daktulosphaira vitifoliae]|uniref:uncharacterized protein LOC126900972 n=1 Tax=Daktulosphaira vitifoliae TaxID=58002 RepID=UPI0021AA549B|nr:uncharacterized protein LOC126900972 [Daktulosphaira vitifoliae]
MRKSKKCVEVKSDSILNIQFLKIFYLYPVIDPNTNYNTICGYNIYLILHEALKVIIAIVLIISITGFFFGIHDLNFVINSSNIIICAILDITKVSRFTRTPHKVWNLISMINIDIFKNGHYRNDIVELYKNKITKYTILNTAAWLLVLLFYLCGPIFVHRFTVKSNDDHIIVYPYNVINLLYQPLSIENYTNFYIMFYILEAFSVVHSITMCIIFDNFVISLGLTVLAQLKTIESTLHTFGHQPNNKNVDLNLFKYKFSSILSDHQKVMVHKNEFYNISKSIVLLQIAVCSVTLNTISCLCILAYVQNIPSLSYLTIKNIVAITMIIIQLYSYCVLFGKIDQQTSSMNFAYYSCNWTSKDTHFKKLLLLAMITSSANQVKMKVTPLKKVNLEMFLNTINTSYSIISLFIQKNHKKMT